MAMVECKECGGQISQNAETCPHCGDVIKEPKPKFSLVDLIHKISVPVVLSVAGTMITILSYFSMEGERQMEQTRKQRGHQLLETIENDVRHAVQGSTIVTHLESLDDPTSWYDETLDRDLDAAKPKD
jgi:hypothetical protein